MAPKGPKVDPLPNNGTLKVYWNGSPEAPTDSADYELAAIHYDLNEETGVAVCTLNEPDRLNALTENQIWEYMLVLQHAAKDPAVKVLVWTGRGRAFSSGADLSGKAPPCQLRPEVMEWFKEEAGFTPGASGMDIALKCLTLRFWEFPKPSIVAVNGLAVGGAANIALANWNDLVYASTDAKFKYPFVDLGLTPELGSSLMMPQSIGMTKAKEMFLLGEWFSAQDAKELGLVIDVMKPEDLMPRAMAVAEKLAKKDPFAVSRSKKLINSHVYKAMDQVMDDENDAIMEVVMAMMQKQKAQKKLKKKSKL